MERADALGRIHEDRDGHQVVGAASADESGFPAPPHSRKEIATQHGTQSICKNPSCSGISVGGPAIESNSNNEKEKSRDSSTKPNPEVPAVQNKNNPPSAGNRGHNSKDREEERAKEDLAAQQSMARSTEAMLILSRFQAFIGGVGTFAVIIALYYNHLSTKAAREAAKAATGTLELSTMGYLFPQHVNIRKAHISYADSSGENAFLFEVSFKNLGSAPAAISRIVTSRRLIDAAADPASIDWAFKVPEANWNTTVGPSVPFGVSEIDMSVREARLVFDRKSHFFIMIRIDYRNIFDKSKIYHTQQGYEIAIMSDPDGIYNASADLGRYIIFKDYAFISSAS